MKTVNDWKFVCTAIEKYLSDNDVGVTDFYLVGSKVENENSNSDFDSLIIIDGYSKDIISLRQLRKDIDSFIKSENISDLFHYKIFNSNELNLIASYDAFRLADFQRRNISIKNSQIINSSIPILNKKNFINSFLIQLVHKFIYDFDNPNTKDIYPKLLFWIQFNLDIKEVTPRNSVSFQYFINNDSLIATLWNFFHSENKNYAEMRNLFNEYFLRLRHESINKYDTYFKIIDLNEKANTKNI